MIKLVFLLKRRAGMSFDDFKKYYETRHAVLGRKFLPTAVRYQRRFLQAYGAPAGYENPDDGYDCITEMWFTDRAALDAAMAGASTPDVAAILAEDEEKLFDRNKIRFYLVEEECPAL